MSPSEHPRLRRSISAIVGVSVAMIFGATPAMAQGADAPTEPPAGDPDSDESGDQTPDGLEGGFDFGGSVVIDEDGTVRWNVQSENDIAEDDPAVAPTPVPEEGVAGTGDVDGQGGDSDSEEDPAGGVTTPGDPLNGENAAGSGNGIVMILGILGGVVALSLGVIAFVRSRRAAAAEQAGVEEVIDPLAPIEEMPSSAPAYAGAEEAGAYEEGGAAYAQHSEGDYEAAKAAADADQAATSAPVSDGSRIDQLRESVVALADKGLEDSGRAQLVAQRLEAAGSKMRPGEWLVMAIAGTVGALFGITFLLGWLLGLVAGVLVGAGFWMALDYMQGKRQKAFAEGLPETLGLIAGSLRGGMSMLQAIGTVAEEAEEPTAEEFQRVITETRLGRDLAVSFRDLSQRMDSKDFEWVVTAIEIHREVGGDLSSILDRVANTIRSRNTVRGQVKALSAEGRASGLILFMLPPVMVFGISILNREYLNEMLNDKAGQIMMAVAIVLLLVGGAWLKRLARFVY